jgi:nucleoside-diphosphate-sugar epimerase
MRALILGGTGFAGRALIARLHGEEPGIGLTVVSRTATSLPGIRRMITGRFGDLCRSAEFQRQLGDMDVIVHLADGLSILQEPHFAADTAEADRLVASSEALAVAVRNANVPLLVHVSSIKAICDEDDARVLTEASEPRSTSLYGRSKLRLEQVIASALRGSGTRVVIVRNPVMYGAGQDGSMHRLLELADTALPLPLGGLTNRRSLLAVDNFASALAAMVRAGPRATSGVCHVHDGPALSTTEILTTLRAALGRPARLFSVGAMGAAVARQAPLIAATARRLYGSLELSDAHFRRCFQWTPLVETKAALAEMAQAYATGPRSHAISAAAPYRH